ncbi:MAG: hypothetical protein ACLPPF_21155 [Rhodomicrobium sp.]
MSSIASRIPNSEEVATGAGRFLATRRTFVFAALLASAAALSGNQAGAQQVAANTPNFSACDQMSGTDPAGAVSCRVKALNAHAAAARQESATARAETREAERDGKCVDQIKSEMAAGRITADAVRSALAGRRTRDVGACNLLGMLSRS